MPSPISAGGSAALGGNPEHRTMKSRKEFILRILAWGDHRPVLFSILLLPVSLAVAAICVTWTQPTYHQQPQDDLRKILVFLAVLYAYMMTGFHVGRFYRRKVKAHRDRLF
jgi:hypothetical protein